MKKILITILSIFGICFSFCSAENYVFNSQDTNYIYDSSFNLVSEGVFWGRNNATMGSSSSTDSQKVSLLGFMTGAAYLNYICFDIRYPGQISFYSDFYLNGIKFTDYTLTDSILCYNFSDLLLTGNSFDYYFIKYDGTHFIPYLDYGSNTFFKIYPNSWSNYYYSLGSGKFFTIDSSYTFNSSYARMVYSFGISSASSPKFKVNYGSTSYEYELNDNLFIHLKSPTIQNGNTFSYAGSTGINLFYNGTSQFYSKSNLYLESMYWFNNNIFTPICL